MQLSDFLSQHSHTHDICWYHASPYTHPQEGIRRRRYLEASYFYKVFVEADIPTFAPIAFHHDLALVLDLPKDAGFWARVNYTWLRRCDSMVVITLPGWKESVGITHEVANAKAHAKEIHYIYPTNGVWDQLHRGTWNPDQFQITTTLPPE